MKKAIRLVAGLSLLVLSIASHAQSKTGADYFAGKWQVVFSGTLYGDLKRVYILEKKDNGLAGIVLDSTGTQLATCSKIDVKDNNITLSYAVAGVDVNVVLTRKDEDHVTGIAESTMGKFDGKGERIKQKLQ